VTDCRRARHHRFENRFFDCRHHHVIDIGWLLFAQILEIFFQAFFDGILDTFFTHYVLLLFFFRC